MNKVYICLHLLLSTKGLHSLEQFTITSHNSDYTIHYYHTDSLVLTLSFADKNENKLNQLRARQCHYC